MKKLYFLILFFMTMLSPDLIQAQRIALGPELGYGIGGYFLDNNNNRYDENSPSKYYSKIGLTCYIRPDKAETVTKLYFKTGILFNRIAWTDKNLNFAQLPLGVDFNIGKKFAFILGGGFSLNYLFLYKHFDSEFKSTRNLFQIGGYFNSGFGYHFNGKIFIDLKIQIGSDFTTLFTKQILTGHNYQSTEMLPEKIRYGILYTSLRYCINKK